MGPAPSPHRRGGGFVYRLPSVNEHPLSVRVRCHSQAADKALCSGPWGASMRAQFSGSASAALRSYFAHSCAESYVGRYDDKSPKEAFGMFRSRARCVWVRVIRPFAPRVTLSWTEAASSLICSRRPPVLRARVTTPTPTPRTITFSTPSFGKPGAVFTPVRGGRFAIRARR